MWHGYYGSGGWWMMGFGMIFWVALGALVIWAIMRVTGGHRVARGDSLGEGSLELLKRRLASGEIDETEFQRIKKHLQER
jgi:putative membrane protein